MWTENHSMHIIILFENCYINNWFILYRHKRAPWNVFSHCSLCEIVDFANWLGCGFTGVNQGLLKCIVYGAHSMHTHKERKIEFSWILPLITRTHMWKKNTQSVGICVYVSSCLVWDWRDLDNKTRITSK